MTGPGQVRLRPPRNEVCGRAIGWWATQAVLAWLIPVIPLVILTLTVPDARWRLAVATVSVTLIGTAYCLVMPFWRYRVHRWEVTDSAVYVSSGWLYQEWRVAPMSRIQTVDSERGPLQQLFRLSTVTVTTASAKGALRLEGLDAELAADLVEHLTAATRAIPGDAT